MTAIQRCCLCLLALVLTACAAPRLTPQQAASIQSVGIVSLLPQAVKYRKIGLTAVNNEFQSVPVAGDVFNVHARAAAEQALRQRGRYQVKQIAVHDGPALAALLNARTLVTSHSMERIDQAVADLAKANGVDAVVVIAENLDPQRGADGLSMVLRAGLKDVRGASAMADVQVSGVTAGKSIVMSSRSAPGLGMVVFRPDNTPWRFALADNLDDATHQAVVRAFLPDITLAIDNAMKEAGLY